MEAEFWLQHWRENEIGFHRPTVHPLLTRFWSRLGIDDSSPVLVPLCGKSLDMVWLRGQGHPVTGVELSHTALARFVRENDLSLSRTEAGFSGRGWRLIAADWFDLSLAQRHSAFYDRAALVALTPDQRAAYVEKLRSLLTPGATGLLVTLEYEQNDMGGPPFSVSADEVRDLYSASAGVEELHRPEALHEEPHFAEHGLTALQEVAWRIRIR